MGAFASIAVLLLCGFTFLRSEVSWAYLAVLAVFEIWLMRRIASVGKGPVAADEPPYRFSAEEAELVARYRFYFTYPGAAREATSVLAALGLTALVLVPWLTYKLEFVQALLIGANLFVVARFTKALAPVMALRVRAHQGDRAALRMLELHDPLWKKIRDAVLQPASDPH
jgi:hypothetical protein